MSHVPVVLLAACAGLALAGCPGEDELVCVELDTACAPLYPPTWENVFANTLEPKCGTGGSGCHEGAGARGGLRLDDSTLAFQSLTTTLKNYVDPGTPGCGEMIERVYSTASSLRMPRGTALVEAEKCALAQWVLAGAPGPVDAGVAP